MAKISETIDKMIDSIPGVTVSTEGLPKKYQPRVDTDESVDIFEDTDTVYDSATGETITKSADVIREERKQVGKDREEAILQNLSKIIPNAADWATEELIFPLYAPTALVKYAMDIVGGPDIPSASVLNNFVSAIEAEQYAQGTGPIESGAYTVGSSGVGLAGGALVYEAALDKVKKELPKVYKGLTRLFPYWVDHVHNNAPGIIKNAKKATKGQKALGLIAGFGKQIKHMVQVPGDIRFRAGANLGRLAIGGTGAGILINLLMSKPTGGEGLMADTPSERIKYLSAEMLKIGYKNKYGVDIDLSSDDIIYDQQDNTMVLTPGKVAEVIARTGEYIPIDTNEIEMVQDVLGYGYDTETDEESLAKSKKIEEEYIAEQERYKNLPLNRKIGEGLEYFFEDVGSRKLPQDIKKLAGLPFSLLKKIRDSEYVQSSKQSFQEALGIADPVEGSEEKPFDLYSMTDEGIIEDAKDMAENERYMQDKMDKTLQTAPSINQMAVGGEPGQFSDSMITGMEEDINVDDIINQPGFESMSDFDIFEEAKKQGYQEYEVAGKLLGKVPLWAIGDVPKPNILTQDLTKTQKKLLDDLAKKVGNEDEVLTQIDEISEAFVTPAGDTAVDVAKTKKTIIDSPEDAESVFYSGLEARLMDPNTPKTFNSADDFFKFLQNKQISKKEVGDNILDNYIAVSTKNGTPLNTADMLKIVRQAPMRKVESVIYGDASYGGAKQAKYPGYQEPGALPNSYRESVLYLDPKHIPQDPDKIPGTVHDFTERYVIGWSRLTDRNATLPVEKTAQGIEESVDPAMSRTLKRNQKKIDRQLKGLEFSAIRRLQREGLIDLGSDEYIDDLTMAEVRNILDIDTMAKLRSIDEPLEQQILQFRMKMDSDAAKLQKMEAATKGPQAIVTFADEIQSDILQQAKKLENDLREQLGDILDLPKDKRSKALGEQRTRYQGGARNVEPEVLDFYTQNETIFRPMFSTAEEMQGFVDEFVKNKQAIEVVAKGGPTPSDDAIKAMNAAIAKEKKMLEQLNVGLSEGALKQLFPNLPFKSRDEWGDILIKRDLTEAAQRLFIDKVDGAAQWYAVTPANLVKNRYSQSGGTAVPINQRTRDMKGIGTEEFYGGPTSVDSKGKHYTSTVEKALKRAAKENNSEFKIIKVDGVGDVFAVKLTPEMLLPHKTHRKKGGMVYTPEIIDIFEAA